MSNIHAFLDTLAWSEIGPTIDTARTVTDYTHDGQGGITTGQVPGATASLDWTSTARRAS